MLPGSAMAGENWDGDWLSPMGVDLQMNGGLGLAFSELTPKDLPRLFALLDQLWIDGVEAICPTIVSCGVDSLRQALLALHQARNHRRLKCCDLLGAHLEGPFISAERRGAHSVHDLCEPSLKRLHERISGFENEISLVTLAPELPGSLDVIKRLRSLGVVVCLGHSIADASTCNRAFHQGIGMLTHTFNAMEGLHHRAIGPVGEAFANGKIAFGLIADGVHVAPTMALLLQRLAPEQVVLVSDALAPYGLVDGKYRWDKRVLIVEKGICYLEDGTLAGGSLPLLEGCRRLALWSGQPAAAIWAATIAPRRVLGEGLDAQIQLVGQPFRKLLRWRWKPDDNDLSWHFAA